MKFELIFVSEISKRMPRHKNSISGGKGGRPKGKGFKSFSREDGISCPVELCCLIRRADKIKQHWRETVLWTEQGIPANEMHPDHGGLSDEMKRHTDFFRLNGYSSTKMPCVI